MQSINAQSAARAAVLAGLRGIPKVGGVLSGLADVLWPKDEPDVWSQIRGDAEALINEKLDEMLLSNVQNLLDGLKALLVRYIAAVGPDERGRRYDAVNNFCIAEAPVFMGANNDMHTKVLLLPTFAQFANLHLSLLRDGMLFGADWGLDTRKERDDLSTRIREYHRHAWDSYEGGKRFIDRSEVWVGEVKVWDGEDGDRKPTISWMAGNRYLREMRLAVRDYADTWPSFEQRNPVAVKLRRVIWSDPIGGFWDDAHGPQTSSLARNSERLSQIAVRGWERIDAIAIGFGDEQLGQLEGNVEGGSLRPPNGFSTRLDDDPIETVTPGRPYVFRTRSGVELKAASSGSTSHGDTLGYPGHVLSDILVGPLSYRPGPPHISCLIFGFRLDDSFDDDARLPVADSFFSYGRGYRRPSAWLSGHVVCLGGAIAKPSEAAWGHVATLPEGLRPVRKVVLWGRQGSRLNEVHAWPDGRIVVADGDDEADALSLDGMCFLAGPGRPLKLAEGVTTRSAPQVETTSLEEGQPGVVTVAGVVRSAGGWTLNQRIGTLPSGTNWRPAQRLVFHVMQGGLTSARIDISPKGHMIYRGGLGDGERLVLSGIRFWSGPGEPLELESARTSVQEDYQDASYCKSGTEVLLAGLVTGTDDWVSPVAVLPKDARPKQRRSFGVSREDCGFARVNVDVDGKVWVEQAIDGWVSLAGVRYFIGES